MNRELTPKDILFNVDLNEGDDTRIKLKDIPEVTSAYDKMKRAINIDKEGYNVYLIDSFSKDKLKALTDYIEELYKNYEAPRDICYVTVDDPKKPEPVFVNNGRGNKLKEAVENIKNSYYEAAMEFYNTSSQTEKDSIVDDVHSKRTSYIGELIEISRAEGFDVKATSGGFAFIPLKDEEAMTEKEYDELSDEEKDQIVLKASELKKKAEVVLEKLKDIEVNSITKLKDIYSEFIDVQMEDNKEDCLLDFIDDDDAYEYLEKVFYSIERELVDCYTMNVEEDEEEISELLERYDITVLVDNSKHQHPRVIYEEDPNVNNLFGNVEYENHNGMYTTELSLINAGSMLLANEGCIIIRLNQLAINNYSYYYLKKTLMSGNLSIDSSRGYLDILSINGVDPKPIPVNVKVILIGDYESYDILYNGDEDFKDLFPIRIEVANYIKNNPIKGKRLKEFILDRAKKNYINKISDEAIKEIIKYLSRVAECRNKICIQEKNVDRLLILASNIVELDGRDTITSKDITKVAYEDSLVEKEMLEMYEDNKIILSLSGERVGSINGLAVLSSGYFNFGKPMRLTCVACKGEGKIIDIQKESNMSGSIHEKSVNILSGLLSNVITPYEKLPVDFHLSFEQTYGQVDGDSASVAEILCILSALSKVGIRQNIAVTGSINQFGEVQAIGGVNEKIEGFYKVCKLLGDTKDKGVLIPFSNKDDLILNSEVEQAVNNGEFHIYTMETLQDAVEVMMLDNKTSYKDLIRIIEKEIEKYKSKSK